MTWAAKSAPSATCWCLWITGSGWKGFGVDEGYPGDDGKLSLGELAQALEGAKSSVPKFDLIGFNACLMSNVEVALTLAPYG